jgi:hypothetical protein
MKFCNWWKMIVLAVLASANVPEEARTRIAQGVMRGLLDAHRKLPSVEELRRLTRTLLQDVPLPFWAEPLGQEGDIRTWMAACLAQELARSRFFSSTWNPGDLVPGRIGPPRPHFWMPTSLLLG